MDVDKSEYMVCWCELCLACNMGILHTSPLNLLKLNRIFLHTILMHLVSNLCFTIAYYITYKPVIIVSLFSLAYILSMCVSSICTSAEVTHPHLPCLLGTVRWHYIPDAFASDKVMAKYEPCLLGTVRWRYIPDAFASKKVMAKYEP